jgi:uncharacterized iron-regulated membrane protein
LKTIRSVLFWLHLVAGVIAGAAIGIMCFTGTMLAFEQEIVAWAERDARQVTVPGEARRLTLGELQQNLGAAQPAFRATSLILENQPTAAVAFSAGREGAFYANPYTGEIRQPGSTSGRKFMQTMTDWHRYLARSGDERAIGKLVNGIANLAFCFLALSGLYLWMPRSWSWRSVRAVAVPTLRASGKARDFNWHNAIGLWCAPVLIVLTLTAIPISFRWGGDLIYRLAGEPIPAANGSGGAPSANVAVTPPSAEARPLALDALVATAQHEFPRWSQLTLRLGGAGAPGTEPAGNSSRAASAVTLTLRETNSWPRTATTTLTLDPYTGKELTRAGYADLSTARQIRSWTRYLHTGQALGWAGQLVAGLACVGGCVLVYTGVALSVRRFFGKKPPAVPPTET